jgi:hypothetical protein
MLRRRGTQRIFETAEQRKSQIGLEALICHKAPEKHKEMNATGKNCEWFLDEQQSDIEFHDISKASKTNIGGL